MKTKINKKVFIGICIVAILIIIILLVGLYIYNSQSSISKQKAKKKVIENAEDIIYKKTKETHIKENINFDEIKRDGNNYKITFFYAGTGFDYVINAKSGKIISNTLNDYQGSLELVQTEHITEEEAKKLVIDDIKPEDENKLKFTKVKEEKGLEKLLYEFHCSDDNFNYQYTVDAISKSIITYLTEKEAKKSNSNKN